MSAFVNLIGSSFGRWSVINLAESSASGQTRWLCRCVCGNESVVQGGALKSGHSQSCGCLKVERTKERSTTHGHTKGHKFTPTYNSWAGMIARCTNPNNDAFSFYGGRGIKVCEEWFKFDNFLRDMGDKPRGHSIERKDGNGNYELSNCCWATLKIQGRNKRNNTTIVHNGVSKTIAELSEETGIPQSTISYRLLMGRPPLL